MTSAGRHTGAIISKILCKNLYLDILAIYGIRDLFSKCYLVLIQNEWIKIISDFYQKVFFSNIFYLAFLVAKSKSIRGFVCPSLGPWVHTYVGPSICRSVKRFSKTANSSLFK